MSVPLDESPPQLGEQRFRDFLNASAPPRGDTIFTLFSAIFGRGATNPQAGDGEQTCDPLAEFLFVKPTPISVRSSVVAHAVNAVHAMAHEMVQVVLPYVNAQVGGDVVSFANLRLGVSVFNTMGGLVAGTVSDKAGPKTALLLSHTSSAVKFLLVGAASSINVLYLSALPAVAIHSFQSTMHVVSLHSDDANRSRALGRVGALCGAGFFAGGAVVIGALYFLSPYKIAFVAAGMEVAAVAVTTLYYPTEPEEIQQEREAIIPFSTWHVLSRPGVIPVLAFKLLVSASAGSVMFMAQQFAMDPFGFSAQEAALMTAYLGGLHILSQSIVPESISPRIIFASTALSVGGSLLGMGLMPATKLVYIIWLAPLALSFHSSLTSLNSLLTLYAPQEELGTLLGMSVSTMSASHILALPMAAHIFKAYQFSAVPLTSCTVLFAGALLFWGSGCVPRELDTPNEDINEVQSTD